MEGPPPDADCPAVDPSEAVAALGRVLEAEPFARSARSSGFLAYVVAETLAGVRRNEEVGEEQGDDDMAGDCFEASTLKELAETIRESKPRGVAESIRDELAYAIRTENFERAAKLRDDLRLMESSATPPLPAPREPVRLKP